MATPKRLYTGQVGTVNETLYTVPVGTTSIVKNIVLTNTAVNASTITLNLVPNGFETDKTNQIISELNVNPNETVVVDFSAVLADGDKIDGLQSNVGNITAYVSGVEVTV